MVKRVYIETVKKYLIGAGITVGTLIGGLFLYLNFLGVIEITGYSGDQICAGTIDDPCYAYINLTAKEDIFIYPTNYDPWGRDTIMQFDPAVKSWKLQRSWGNGWRDIPLNETCTGTWCGAPNNKGVKYSYVLREGRDYQFRIVAYKNSPYEDIKWAVNYGDKEYLDPVWKGKSDIIYTPTTDTICKDGTCTKTLWSGVRNVYEDDTWKKIEKARSLKNASFKIIYLENDKNYEIEIDDFNYTCLKKLKIKSQIVGNIPFKINHVNYVSPYMEAGKEIELEDICVDNIFNYNFTLGSNSTTIKLQTADTENLADIYYLDASFLLGVQIKWNITSIPSGQTIEDSTLCFYIAQVHGSLDNDTRVWRVNDQNWDENSNATTLESQSLTNQTDENFSSITVGTWTCVSATKMIQTDYNLGNDNSSIRFEDLDYLPGTINGVADGEGLGIGNGGNNILLVFEDKEGYFETGAFPYLNITYSEAAPTDTCTCPGAGNNWEVNMSHNCNLTTACTLTTGNLTWIGASGYFNCSANLNLTNRDAPPSGTTFYHSSGCEIIYLIVLIFSTTIFKFRRIFD